ncbi:MAG: hypothetical protein AMXMBFR82_35600 [Candidatus Hydrogenedentota bacterium]
MSYRGHVKGGVVVLDQAAVLPEGTAVNVIPIRGEQRDHHPDVQKFGGIIESARTADRQEEYVAHLRKKHQ